MEKSLNNVFLYYNIGISGIRSDINAAKENPVGWSAKFAAYHLFPRLLMRAAGFGLLGEELRYMESGVPNYDKDNFIIIPFGWTGDTSLVKEDGTPDYKNMGRPIYFVMPTDPNAKLLNSVVQTVFDHVQGTFTKSGKENPNLRKSGGTALQEGDVGYRGITNRNNSIADSLNVTQEQVTEETSTTPDPLEKMFNYVSDKKYYSKTYDEFKEQYSTEEAQEKLYDFVKKKKAYSKSKGEFLNQYFPITDETTEEVETTEEKTTEEAETTEVFESKIGKDQQKAKIKEFNSLDPEQKNAKAEAEGFSNSFEYKQWLMGAERTTKELHGDKGETVVRHSVSKENQVDEGLIDNFITQGNNDVVVDLMTLEERKAEDAARQEISQEDWEATRPEKSTGVEVFEGVGGFITDAISEIGTIISQGYQMTPLGEGEIVRGGGSAKQREKQERESLENAYSKVGNQIPWKFWNERDVRTLVSFAPNVKSEFVFKGVAHNAIDDCKFQIGYCCKIWNKLNN